jgi:predicted transcriptional regulator
MNRRRSSLECQVVILGALEHQSQPIKITHLIYRTNLNASRLKQYLNSLKKEGLVKEFIGPQGGKYYLITERGTAALSHFRQFIDIMPGKKTEVNYFGV